MTAMSEPASAQSVRSAPTSPVTSPILAMAAPALILLAIVVQFLRYDEYDLLLPESLILMGGAASIGVVSGLLSRLRPTTLGPALMALTLSAYVFYRPEVTGRIVGMARYVGDLIGNPGLVLGLICVALYMTACIVCWLLQKHLATIVAAIFGTIVLSSILLPTATGGEPVEAGALPQRLADLPPVIHVILDEHIGLAALPAEVEESAEAAVAIETTYRDFALYSRAYSRFAETQNSLGALMNNVRGAEVLDLLSIHGAGYRLRQNAWLDQLKAEGYAVKVYQTPWLDMCKSTSVDACYTYSIHSPNAVQRTTLSTRARLQILLSRLHLWRTNPFPGSIAATEAFDRLRFDLARAPRGVAYIAHLMLPHYDYLYRRDCSLIDPTDWQTQPGHFDDTPSPVQRQATYRLYLEQMICTDQHMRQLFASLRAVGAYEDATIIVHGDHGSRIAAINTEAPAAMFSDRDLLDYFATFLAIKTSTIVPGLREEPVLLQQTFADEFLVGAGDPATPDEVLLHEDNDTFAPRRLRWPGYPPSEPHLSSDLSSLRRSTDIE